MHYYEPNICDALAYFNYKNLLQKSRQKMQDCVKKAKQIFPVFLQVKAYAIYLNVINSSGAGFPSSS